MESTFKNIRKKNQKKKKCPRAQPTDINLCAFSKDSADICQGDSGGGLVTYNPEGWVQMVMTQPDNHPFRFYELLGVVSYNLGCNSTFQGANNYLLDIKRHY